MGQASDEPFQLFGNALANTLAGNRASNSIAGGGGTDTLLGDAGNDILNGGLAKDTLLGGVGADTFRFASSADTAVGAARDLIVDWENSDRIDVAQIDANTITAGNQDFTFLGLGSADRNVAQGAIKFYHFGGNTFVVGNATPDGVADLAADFQIEILGGHTLTSSNFVGIL